MAGQSSPRDAKMLKVDPAPGYPGEEGCYLRGNDLSPVAVVIILSTFQDQVPPEIETLVRVSVESGAALAGTLQTENIGIEKVVCNIIGNPNIRYIVLGGPESPGHLTGEAVAALVANGVDERKNIIGANAPTPYLFNIPMEYIERFRAQIELVNLMDEFDPELYREAVWSCFQESPTDFREYSLYDPGAFPQPPIDAKITWRVTKPWAEPKDEEERVQKERIQDLIEEIRSKVEKKGHR